MAPDYLDFWNKWMVIVVSIGTAGLLVIIGLLYAIWKGGPHV